MGGRLQQRVKLGANQFDGERRMFSAEDDLLPVAGTHERHSVDEPGRTQLLSQLA